MAVTLLIGGTSSCGGQGATHTVDGAREATPRITQECTVSGTTYARAGHGILVENERQGGRIVVLKGFVDGLDCDESRLVARFAGPAGPRDPLGAEVEKICYSAGLAVLRVSSPDLPPPVDLGWEPESETQEVAALLHTYPPLDLLGVDALPSLRAPVPGVYSAQVGFRGNGPPGCNGATLTTESGSYIGVLLDSGTVVPASTIRTTLDECLRTTAPAGEPVTEESHQRPTARQDEGPSELLQPIPGGDSRLQAFAIPVAYDPPRAMVAWRADGSGFVVAQHQAPSGRPCETTIELYTARPPSKAAGTTAPFCADSTALSASGVVVEHRERQTVVVLDLDTLETKKSYQVRNPDRSDGGWRNQFSSVVTSPRSRVAFFVGVAGPDESNRGTVGIDLTTGKEGPPTLPGACDEAFIPPSGDMLFCTGISSALDAYEVTGLGLGEVHHLSQTAIHRQIFQRPPSQRIASHDEIRASFTQVFVSANGTFLGTFDGGTSRIVKVFRTAKGGDLVAVFTMPTGLAFPRFRGDGPDLLALRIDRPTQTKELVRLDDDGELLDTYPLPVTLDVDWTSWFTPSPDGSSLVLMSAGLGKNPLVLITLSP